MGATSQVRPYLKIIIAITYIAEKHFEIDTIIVPPLQLRKLRCKQVKQIANVTQ